MVVANGFLPTADRPVPKAFHVWRAFARYTPVFPVGRIVASGDKDLARKLEAEGYDKWVGRSEGDSDADAGSVAAVA